MRRLLAAFLLLAPAAAQAFETIDRLPWPSLGGFPAYTEEVPGPGRFWAQIGVLRDNNILRLPDGEQSETVTRAGVGTSYDARIYSRQRLRLEARADAFIYNRFNDLNYVGYGLLAEWGWELGNSLSGVLGYGRSRFQTDLSELQAAVSDLITENRVYGTAAWRVANDWRLRGGFDAVDYDRPERRTAESTDTAVHAGIDYVTPIGNAIGIEVRKAEGDAPVSEEVDPLGLFVNNDYEEQEVSGVLSYAVGPQLRIAARLGRTKRTYSEIPGRDFDDNTGRFDIGWRPGNKILLTFEAYKVPRSIITVGASHVLVEGTAFGVSWAPRAKLVWTARFVNEDRLYSGDPAAALGVDVLRDEMVRFWSFAMGWELTRRHLIGFALDTGDRSSNVLGRDYDFVTLTANLRYQFQ
jgi:hypothetical protein